MNLAKKIASAWLLKLAAESAFTKLKDGSWGIKIDPKEYKRLGKISVKTRGGQTKTVTMDKKIWEGKDKWSGDMVALVTLVPDRTPTKPAPSRTQYEQEDNESEPFVEGYPHPSRPRNRKYECEECGDLVFPGTRCWETGHQH